MSQVELFLQCGRLIIIRETSVATGTKGDENSKVLAEIKDGVCELKNRKVDLDIDVSIHGSSLIEVQQTRASPVTTRVEVEVRLEPSTVMDEIRNELMLLRTGQGPYASSVDAVLLTLSRLSHEDREKVASSLVMGQLHRPNDPRSTNNFAAPRRSSYRRSASQPMECCCGVKTHNTGKAFRWGPLSLGFGYENQIRHHPSCPCSRENASKHTWKYQLCMRLLPLANKTVQFAFSATIGEGGLDLRFPLKVFPTVQRANSEIFRMFDNFADQCAIISHMPTYDNDQLYLMWDLNYSNVHGFNWDVGRVREQLRYMHTVLRNAHSPQIGSIRDMDESGYTVLHVGCLPPTCRIRIVGHFPEMIQYISIILPLVLLTSIR